MKNTEKCRVIKKQSAQRQQSLTCPKPQSLRTCRIRKIFYYRENEDDKRALGKLIKNLILMMGQDELIKRTGGVNKTIEFIPQTIE